MPAEIPPAAAPVAAPAPAPPPPPAPAGACANALLATNTDATMTASALLIFSSCINLRKNRIRMETPVFEKLLSTKTGKLQVCN
jgi:hypothetical protein